MKKWFVLTVLVVISCTLSNAQDEKAKNEEEKINSAVDSAGEWLQLVDTSNYAESWETASSVFKKAVTQNGWPNTVKEVRDPLGKFVDRTVISKKYKTTLTSAPDGEYVVIIYQSKYVNKATVYETVVEMKDEDGNWRVAGYFIK